MANSAERAPRRQAPGPPGADGHERAGAPALAGRLSAVSLFDLCQFLMLNRKTGVLKVRADTALAHITFHEGQLVDANDEQLRSGEAVVLRAVQWNEGTFEFQPGPVPPDRRIQSSTENVLLEAARRLDEMQCGADGAGGSESAAEAHFRETQQRAASLSDTFRSALAQVEAAQRLAGAVEPWKEPVAQALAQPGALRLLVDPDGRAMVVAGAGVQPFGGLPPEELRERLEELLPPDARGSRIRPGDAAARKEAAPAGRPPRGAKLAEAPRAGVRGGSGGRAAAIHTPAPGGSTFWIRRLPSADGDGYAVSLAGRNLPDAKFLGLPDDVFEELERLAPPLWLLRVEGPPGTNPVDSIGAAVLAAWLRRRASVRPEVVWVIESLPQYDWTVLPGRVRSVLPETLRGAGDLAALCAAGAGGVVAALAPPPWVLAEVPALVGAGAQVVVALGGPAAEHPPGQTPPRGAGDSAPTVGVPLAWDAVLRIAPARPPESLPLTARLTAAGRPNGPA